MWEPLGPLPPSVYWRRRAVALGAAVLVLVGLVWGVAAASGGSGDPADPAGDGADRATVEARARAAALERSAAPDQPEQGSPDVAGTPGPIAAALPPGIAGQAGPAGTVLPPGAAPGVPNGLPTGLPGEPGAALLAPPGGDGFRGIPPAASSTPPPAATTTTSPPGPPEPPATCADGDLRVTARTDAPRYAAGQRPVLSLVVTNTGSAPCVRDLDAARQAVAVVRTPGDGLWGSNDCAPGDTDDVRTLAPGEEAVFSVRWSGRTSSPGCAGERSAVPPGDYQLMARLDGIVSDPVAFTLAP